MKKRDPLDSGLSGLRFCLGHLNFGDSNLPFDLAQGGEPVEPFRILANFIRDQASFGFPVYPG